MKKVFALFVLALFVVSMIPAAFAEEPAGAADDTVVATEDAADETADGAPGREKLRDRVKDARDKIANARDKAVDNRERLIAAKDELLAKHQEIVQKLVDKCKETGKTEEECKAQFEKRLENIAALAPKFREKLKEFEAKRAERGKSLKELANDTFLGKINKAKEFRARNVDKAKIAEAKAKLTRAKEKFMDAKLGLDKAKIRLETAKTSKVCKDNPDSQECANAKNETRVAAKERLAQEADIILTHLEKAKEAATGSEYLSDEEEAKVIAYIDEQAAKFTAIKAEIEKAQTKEEIVAAANKLADAWKEIKHKINAYMSYIANSRMAGVVVKAEHLSAKLERVLERMAENGKDTAAIEPLVTDFKAKIGTAKEKFKSANSLLLEIRTSGTLNEEQKKAKADEAKSLIDESKAALKDANEVLKNIFQKLKEVGAAKELADATEAEDVETEAEVEDSE